MIRAAEETAIKRRKFCRGGSARLGTEALVAQPHRRGLAMPGAGAGEGEYLEAEGGECQEPIISMGVLQFQFKRIFKIELKL